MNAICARCTKLHASAKSDPWWRWLCTQHPQPQFYNPITGQTIADPPYRFCRHVNDGSCEDFDEGSNILNPKGIPDVPTRTRN